MRHTTELVVQMFDPRGRCNRSGLLIIAVGMLAMQTILVAVLMAAHVPPHGPVVNALNVVFMWLAVAATSKRLHDLGYSPWWTLAGIVATVVWSVVFILGLVSVAGLDVANPASAWHLVALAGTCVPLLGVLLWLHFAMGESGPNRFGPEPHGLGFSMPNAPVAQAAAAG